MKNPIKLLVVDDSSMFRKTLEFVARDHPHLQLVGMAEDGERAMKFVVEHKPDVILLDLEMPRMDGFTFLRWLMVYFPTPVLVISSRSDGYSVFKALELGASDFLNKPSADAALLNHPEELLLKIEILSKISREKISKRYSKLAQSESSAEPSISIPPPSKGCDHLLALGASTGGPPALCEIITHLPEGFPAAVVISQHMPAGFTKSFSERLNKVSYLPVLEVEGGEQLEKGRVYVAPGGHHLLFEKRGAKILAVIKEETSQDRYTPSIDRMMTSAAELFGPKAFGIILTGMGNDGKIGLKRIKEKGGETLAESEETAVVYGMPRESIQAGVVDKILPLHKMVDEILRHYKISNKG